MRTRRGIVQALSENPNYWLMAVRERLALVRQIESRQETNVQAFRIAVVAWLTLKEGNYGRVVYL